MATRKRFTKALFLRLCAVGLFICLGTFAVMHSINNQKKKQMIEEDQQAALEESQDDKASPVPVTDDGTGEVVPVSGIDEDVKSKFAATKKPVGGTSKNSLPPFKGGTNSTTTQTTKPPIKTNPVFRPPTNSFADRGTTDSNRKSASGSRRTIPPLRPNMERPGTTKTSAMQTGSTTRPPGTLPPGPPTRTFPSTSAPTTNSPGPRVVSNFSDTKKPEKNGALKQPGQSSFVPGRKPPASPLDNAVTNAKSTATNLLPGLRQTTPPTAPPTQPKLNASTPSTNTLPNRQSLTDRTTTRPPTQISTGTSSTLPNSTTTPRINSGSRFGSSNPPTPSTQTGSSGVVSSTPTRQAFGSGSTSATNPNGLTRQPNTLPNRTTMSSPIQDENRGVLSSRPRTTLASAPITTNSSRSTIAQPTPGSREFQGVQLPALALQKLMPREIQVNREATFELIVKNTGKAAANEVQVHDFVPQGTRFVESVPPASPTADGRIRWDLGTMIPGQQTSIKLKVVPERPGNVGSVAHVTFGAQASAQTICTKPELVLRAKGPETVLIGQDVVMDIVVENKGNGAAENVVLQEDVPDGLIFNGGQRELEYEVGTLRPGESRNVKLRLRAAKVGQVRNIFAAHGAGQLKATDSVDVRIVAPKLAVQGSGPSIKFLNRKATHTFNVSNLGTAPATNMQLVAQLPRGLQFSAANNQGQYDRRNHAVVWRLNRLDAQKSASVEITTVPVAVGQHQVDFTAAADLNIREKTQKTLSVQQLSELFFDIDDSADAIEVGTGTSYRVKVVNQGQIPAKNVQVKVDFPAAIQPQSVQGSVRNQIQGQSVVIETIPTMQPGQEINFVVTANAMQPGDHRTVVSVKSDDRDIAVSKEESTHVYSDR